ncbi:2,3-diaminopropionate biosynthesis protein SbnB [Streptomyces demainii]|uniref:Ornithine cyclodeaminase n=1 Tax=Streptomyces demainii TaxID=588122 RepID=A0ABT9L6X6_9ACTN|nr:2,3-diaminopropionate biosynthesis protein SbnB [Streptomyces demainii]MDP9616456.1 ornithine cyclodeaminase [Streptomyces demainii]
MNQFSVVSGKVVDELLQGGERQVIDRVRAAYLLHAAGNSINPDSYFLRFPDKPDSRIIALPAYLGGDVDVTGVKWISSFPKNTAVGLPRASAVLVLNDYGTGFPFAVLESAAISAARTAASAALAACTLATRPPATVGVVGGGPIARTICRYLRNSGTPLNQVRCHDLDETAASALSLHLAEAYGSQAAVASLDEALQCDVVVLATTALAPYIPAEQALRPGQLILNISLRDLAPELLLSVNNVLDDVEHCLKADTSPHLAEQLTGNRTFVTGTLADVINGTVRPAPDRPTVFSPFGLGVLDLAVGHYVYTRAAEADKLLDIPDFFGGAR